jgi:hypothetical protein
MTYLPLLGNISVREREREQKQVAAIKSVVKLKFFPESLSSDPWNLNILFLYNKN